MIFFDYLCNRMTKVFKVAGHAFGLSLPDGHPLCSRLGQYEPFIAPDDTPVLFSVELADSIDDAGAEVVYAGSEDPDQPLVRLLKAGDNWIYEMAVCSGRPLAARMISNKDFTKAKWTEKMSIFKPQNPLICMGIKVILHNQHTQHD